MAEESSEQALELAALYALGCVTPEERADVEERLLSGDIALQQELQRCRELVSQIALVAPPAKPAPSLRERLMARVQQPPAQPAPAVLLQEGGLLLSAAGLIPWKHTALPGVWTKTLFVDRKRGFRTSLIRLEPGSEIPGHRHHDVEELFMIEGEMEIHGHVVGPGGYCRAEPDSIHQVGRSKTGCVFLAVCSVRDRYVPA